MWLTIIGLSFLIFRLYATEIKVKPFIGAKNHYFSRMLCYLCAIAVILEFQSLTFNYIVMVSNVSITFVFIIEDVPFFSQFHQLMEKHHVEKQSDRNWILAERLTVHLPQLFVGYWMWAHLFSYFSMQDGFWPIIFALMLTYSCFFGLDTRWKERTREGKYTLFVGTISNLALIIIFPLFLKPILTITTFPC